MKRRLVRPAAAATVVFLVLGGCSAAPAEPLASPSAVATATPSPSPADSGPVDAVIAEFQRAQAGGLQAQLDFLTCVAGGSEALQFSTLFGSLAELALATSGVDVDEFWSAFGTSAEEFRATEKTRSADQATVEVTLKVTIAPDIASLRRLMRASLEQRNQPVDDAAINALVDRLIGRMELKQEVENDVTARLVDGAWHACDLAVRSQTP
jgi:hypothetical protein